MNKFPHRLFVKNKSYIKIKRSNEKEVNEDNEDIQMINLPVILLVLFQGSIEIRSPRNSPFLMHLPTFRERFDSYMY